MQPEPRALLFDLDDTLHPRRRFVTSGLRAVAAHVAATHGVPAAVPIAILADAVRHQPGRELQALTAALGLPADGVASLVEVVRTHAPSIHLSRATRAVLVQLRGAWRLGVVTNGRADVQARKVAALGLASLVETVVYATAGGRAGKPAAAPFLEACARLAVPASRAVFVGDDPTADIEGAAAAGLKTIWLAPRGSGGAVPPHADITVQTIADVPAAARRLLPSWWRPHAA